MEQVTDLETFAQNVQDNWLSEGETPQGQAAYSPSLDVQAQQYQPAVNTYAQQEPGFFQNLAQPFANMGQSILTGAGQTVTGINQQLPNLFTTYLSSKLGLRPVTQTGEDGKPVTLMVPSNIGVPAAGQTTTPVSVSTNTPATTAGLNLNSGTIAVLAVAAVGLFLLMKR